MNLEHRIYSMGDIWNTSAGTDGLYQSLEDLNRVAGAWEQELRESTSWRRKAWNFVKGLFGYKPRQPRIAGLFYDQLGLARKAHRSLQSVLGQLGHELERTRAYQHRLMDEVEHDRKDYHVIREQYGRATEAYAAAEEALAGKRLGDEGYVATAKSLKQARARKDDLERTASLLHDRISQSAGHIVDAESIEEALGQALGTGQLLAQRTEGMIRHLETVGPTLDRYLLAGGSMGELVRHAETLGRRARDIYAIAGTMARSYQRIGDDARRTDVQPFGNGLRTAVLDAVPRDPFGACDELLAGTRTPEPDGRYARRYAG
jgi:hypothetical protein